VTTLGFGDWGVASLACGVRTVCIGACAACFSVCVHGSGVHGVLLPLECGRLPK
jgi:hypothetical protein